VKPRAYGGLRNLADQRMFEPKENLLQFLAVKNLFAKES